MTIPQTPPAERQPSILSVTVAAFTALGYALSARALLLLSLIGAFVLAMRVIDNQTPLALGTLVAYGALTVLPFAYLEVRKGRAQ